MTEVDSSSSGVQMSLLRRISSRKGCKPVFDIQHEYRWYRSMVDDVGGFPSDVRAEVFDDLHDLFSKRSFRKLVAVPSFRPRTIPPFPRLYSSFRR